MNGFIFVSTLKDMLRFNRIWPWVLLGLILFGVSSLWARMSSEGVGPEQYAAITKLIVYRVVALAAAMFTMVVISQEIEQKTIVYLVTRTVPRSVIMWSRGAAAVVAVAVMSWISLGAVAAVMLGLGFLGEGFFWMDLVIMLLGAAAYSTLFIFITLITNRAMIVILAYAFVWESFVPQFTGDMPLLSINFYMTTLATHPSGASGPSGLRALLGGSTSVEPWVAWVVLLGIFLAGMALNAWWFGHFEYLPREDAE